MTGPTTHASATTPAPTCSARSADDEQRAFELHMEQCPECRDEVERLRPAADALPRSVEQLTRAGPAPRVAHGRGRERGDARTRRSRAGAGACATCFPRLGRCGRRSPAPCSCSALLAGYGVAQLTRSEDERTIAAKVDDTRVPMASAELRVEGDGDDGAVLTAEGLPDLGGGRVYQAWVQRGDEIAPAPTFVVDRDGSGAVTAARGPERGRRRARHARAPRRRPGARRDADHARGPVASAWTAPAPPTSLSGRMEVCYRHPNRETGVRCSNCERPICPDCMTTTPVGHALPRVRAAAHQGAHDPERDRRARAHLRPDRDQRGRGAGRAARRSERHGRRHRRQHAAPGRRGVARRDRRRRVLAAGHRRLPARRASSTCSSTCSRSTSSAGCSSPRSGACASG